MDNQEFLAILNKGIGVGFVQAATKRPQDEAIAREVFRVYGEGEILDSALKQLELKMTQDDPPTFYRDPEWEAKKRERLGKWYSYDKLKFEDYPEFHHLATDKLIEHLKTQVHLLEFDGMGDPDQVDAILSLICQRIASAMEEDHCRFLEQAVRAVGHHSTAHPTACVEWRQCNVEMCDRVLKSVYRSTSKA